MNCRHCNSKLEQVFCDLNTCPPSNAMLNAADLNGPEKYFPLRVFVCDKCYLVQTEDMEKAEEIFNNTYTYFSSYSTSWLAHAEKYVGMMIERFQLNSSSQVVEIASNDGYLLQYFKAKNIPVLGIEPTANTASVAAKKGIESIVEFFGSQLAEKKLKQKADLILGNNVLAHVPDINDFVKGVKLALKPNGITTFEFPHLCNLVAENQFDTIYHEHFSYLCLTTVQKIFESQGLVLFDVEELPTHGGSLRIYAKHKECSIHTVKPTVKQLLEKEEKAGVKTINYYTNFQVKVEKIKYDLLDFLLKQKREKKKVIGYGAAAKGNTLLNYCGVKGNDLIEFVVDASPYKQGKFLPGSRIPVVGKEQIEIFKPDYIIIFPWNIQAEIKNELQYIKEWGGRFVIAVPELSFS